MCYDATAALCTERDEMAIPSFETRGNRILRVAPPFVKGDGAQLFVMRSDGIFKLVLAACLHWI